MGIVTGGLWNPRGDAPGTNAEDCVAAMPILREHEILKCPKNMIYIGLFWLSVPDKLVSVAEEAKFAVEERIRAFFRGCHPVLVSCIG